TDEHQRRRRRAKDRMHGTKAAPDDLRSSQSEQNSRTGNDHAVPRREVSQQRGNQNYFRENRKVVSRSEDFSHRQLQRRELLSWQRHRTRENYQTVERRRNRNRKQQRASDCFQ